MFGKLKDKLKGALSVFSKKAEEIAEPVVEEKELAPETKEPEQEQEKEVPVIKEEKEAEPTKEEDDISEEELEKADKLIEETNKEEISTETTESKDSEPAPKEQKPVEEVPTKFVVGQNRFEPDLEEIKETKESKEEVSKEEKEEVVVEEEKKDEIEDISEEELERADKLIEETNQEETPTETTESKDSEPAPKEQKPVEEDKEEDDEDEKFVPIPEVSDDRDIPSAESLIAATKDKFAVEELPQEEQDKIKEAERQPTAAELLEEVTDEVVEDEKEEVIEPVKEKKLFGLFRRKEKEEVIEEKKEVTEKKEEIIEKPVEKELKKAEEVKPEETIEPEEKGFFGKVKQSFTTKTISADKFETLFWELEIALLESNVSVEVIEKTKEDLKEELVDKPLPRDVPKKIEETLKRTLTEILTFDKIDILKKANDKKPLVIAFFGINGSGKTTSIAKLANYLKENNLSVVLAACDTFRAAAIQQLEEHANKLEVKMIKHDYGSDAAAVAFDAVKYAEKHKVDVVLIDTAGRLHSNTNLMAELEKIIRVTNPDLKIFIGESITGNDCIEQARKFNEIVEMDGAILTKADVDEKGGAPLSIAYTIKKPILFLGMGQGYKDFEAFDKNVILERLGF